MQGYLDVIGAVLYRHIAAFEAYHIIKLGTLHGIAYAQIDKYTIAGRQHILAAHAYVEACLRVCETIRRGVGVTEVADVHSKEALEREAWFGHIVQSLGAAGTHDSGQCKSQKFFHTLLNYRFKLSQS